MLSCRGFQREQKLQQRSVVGAEGEGLAPNSRRYLGMLQSSTHRLQKTPAVLPGVGLEPGGTAYQTLTDVIRGPCPGDDEHV